MKIADYLETLTDTYIQVETIKRGGIQTPPPGANTSDNYPHVTTGTNSDGSTLISRSLIGGVSNGALLAGAAALVALGVVAFALAD